MSIVSSSGMKRGILLSLLIAKFIFCTEAQHTTLNRRVQAGDNAPDFIFSDIAIAGKTRLTKNDLRGKFVILDFWSPLCTACVESFPTLNTLQKKFAGKMEFILVGSDVVNGGGTGRAKEIFEKYRRYWNLNLPIAFDTSSFKNYGIEVVSWFVWIDPKGTVQASTGIDGVTEVNIQKFLNREKIHYASREDGDIQFDKSKPLLIGGNGGNDTAFISRSVIAPWDPTSGIEQPAGFGYGKFRARGLSLKQLYHYAYFGVPYFTNTANGDSMYAEVSNRFILETKDSALFIEALNGGKKFSVEIDLPDHSDGKQYMQACQMLLENTFHLQASIEIREMQCWILVATEKARQHLRTKSTRPMKDIYDKTRYDRWGADGIAFKNLLPKSIVTSIYAFHQQEPNFFDGTGINYPIDFSMETIMTSLQDIRRALQEQGLDLVKGTRMLKTIVIRDIFNYSSNNKF